ncbi:hypothetical protein Tco_0828352 [Tanacetum coccineum]
MEHHQQQEHNIVSDEVLFNGIRTTLTLSSDGILYWVDQNGKLSSLCVEKQVLGLTTVGLLITVKTIVSKGGGVFCFGTGSLVRTRFLFKALSADSLRNLSDKIQGYIDSLGIVIIR